MPGATAERGDAAPSGRKTQIEQRMAAEAVTLGNLGVVFTGGA